MDKQQIENRLTDEERKIINDIENKASKRKHKKTYTVKFIINHMLSCSYFKGWEYVERADAIDMLNNTMKIAVMMKQLTPKQAEAHRKDIMEMYIDNWYEQ